MWRYQVLGWVGPNKPDILGEVMMAMSCEVICKKHSAQEKQTGKYELTIKMPRSRRMTVAEA